MKISNLRISIVLSFLFFVFGLLTLTHYGINWDTINHLPRGQAYLHYFLTGKKDYSDLPKYFYDWTDPNQWYFQNPKNLFIDTNITLNKVPTRSLYQTGVADFNYFMATDGDGHPPLSDILSSVFNRVLFGSLRLVNDIDSYRIYGVLLASFLVGLIFYWSTEVYGRFAGFISAIVLSTYPLFWSESHFNTEKDIPETVFWSFMFFAFWKAITTKSWKWMLTMGIFFGLALGTKFNILFSILALIPWAAIFIVRNRKDLVSKKYLKVMASAVGAFILGIFIFVGTWPYLWPDPLTRVMRVIGFYKGIGVASNPVDPRFLGLFGTNTYSIQWIIYATPILVLLLLVVGIFFALRRMCGEKDNISLMFLFWLIVPIARVSWGQANTYGGVRQIMEYIPALALLAGLGASFLINNVKFIINNSKAKAMVVFVIFGILLIPIVTTHPNENVYFNSFVGGLSGAKAKNFPYWGFSFGAPYRSGIEWINEHAEKDALVVYAYELIPNIPRLWIRPDLQLANGNRSGYLRQGEYAITLTYQGTNVRSYYDTYLEDFLDPVYEVKVDGVSILKVWKNDTEHLKNKTSEDVIYNTKIRKNGAGLIFDLGKQVNLSRLEFNYTESKLCKKLAVGYIEISKDKNSWTRLPGVLPDDWRIPVLGEQPKNGKFIEPFLGQEARYIHFSINPLDACVMNVTNSKIYYFK